MRTAARILRSAAWPGIPRRALSLFTLALLLATFLLRRTSELSPAAAAVWILWWGILPMTAALLGRIWCGICPVGWIAEIVERVRKPARRLPKWVVRIAPAVGVGAGGVAFLAAELENSSAGTLGVLSVGALGAVGAGLLFADRAFCRICPVGNLLELYSRRSFTEVGAVPGSAPDAAAVRASVVSCPLKLNAHRGAGPECTFCGSCLKESSLLTVGRRTEREVAPTERREARRDRLHGLAGVVAGLLVADALRMTAVYPSALSVLAGSGAVPYRAASAMWVGGWALAGYVISRLARSQRFVSASVPILLAAHVSLSLQHLWGGAGNAIKAIVSPIIGGSGHIPPSTIYNWDVPLKLIQIALLTAGVLVALRALSGRATRSAPPGWASARTWAFTSTSVAGAGFLAIFLLPMARGC